MGYYIILWLVFVSAINVGLVSAYDCGTVCHWGPWSAWKCDKCCTDTSPTNSAQRNRGICCGSLQTNIALCLKTCGVSPYDSIDKGSCSEHCPCDLNATSTTPYVESTTSRTARTTSRQRQQNSRQSEPWTLQTVNEVTSSVTMNASPIATTEKHTSHGRDAAVKKQLSMSTTSRPFSTFGRTPTSPFILFQSRSLATVTTSTTETSKSTYSAPPTTTSAAFKNMTNQTLNNLSLSTNIPSSDTIPSSIQFTEPSFGNTSGIQVVTTAKNRQAKTASNNTPSTVRNGLLNDLNKTTKSDEDLSGFGVLDRLSGEHGCLTKCKHTTGDLFQCLKTCILQPCNTLVTIGGPCLFVFGLTIGSIVTCCVLRCINKRKEKTRQMKVRPTRRVLGRLNF